MIKPFLKWAGGKRQLLPKILPSIPTKFDRYIEPFIGGGAVFLHLTPKRAIVSDLNSLLTEAYPVIRDDLELLIDRLEKHSILHCKDYYYEIRAMDRDVVKYSQMSITDRVARLIYLNKTGYNGLWRVNKKGQNNVPFGQDFNPKIFDRSTLYAIQDYLNQNRVEFLSADFEQVVNLAKNGDFLYLDPPYAPVKNSAFLGYTAEGFSLADRLRLRDSLVRASNREVRFLLSDSLTEITEEIYGNFKIRVVSCSRSINSLASGRSKVLEIMVSN